MDLTKPEVPNLGVGGRRGERDILGTHGFVLSNYCLSMFVQW
jgi:hypothetical protein